MRVLFLGPPGAGKGTQAVRLAERLRVPYVATGNVLREAREADTPLGLKARKYMDRGELVPDSLVIGIVVDRLSRPDARGFILDGFPRTIPQAEALDELLDSEQRPLHVVVFFDVDEGELVDRAAGRRTCPSCQRSYHIRSNPPEFDEVCDEDGTPLIVREDDEPAVVRRRLQVYKEQTASLCDYYRERGLLVEIDGLGTMDVVAARLDAVLAKLTIANA